jgi:hypothetical protein
MQTTHKLYAALAVLVALGGVFYFTNSNAKAEKDSHNLAAKTDLPDLTLKPEVVERATKLEFKAPDKDAVVLEKGADGWEITAPMKAKANQADVKSLFEALQKLKTTDAIDRGAGAYEKYDVADNKGTRFTLTAGTDKPIDVIFGQSGSRGQTVRVVGRDGVYVADGYQASLFNKDIKGWRDKTILKLEDANVASVTVENDNGKFLFTRDGDNWSGKFDKNPNKKAEPEEKKDEKADKKDEKADKKDEKADKKDEKKDGEEKPAEPKNPGWEKFDGKTVENMLRAFKTLNAVDFAEEKDETGLGAAVKEGGLVTITMKDGTVHKLVIGKKQKGTNRFTQKAGDDTVFVISSWAADWAVADSKKFEKKEEKKGDPKAPPGDPHGGGDEAPEFDLPMDE